MFLVKRNTNKDTEAVFRESGIVSGGGTWPSQSLEHASVNLGVMHSSSTLEIELTLKNNKIKNTLKNE